MRTLAVTSAALFAFAASTAPLACQEPAAAPPPAVPAGHREVATPTDAVDLGVLNKVPRTDLNRIAAELALPIFWTEDKNKNGALDPSELTVYWGLDPAAKTADYVGPKGFTAKMGAAYEAITKRAAEPETATGDEGDRRAAVRKELAQGRVSLAATNLSNASPAEKAFVAHVVAAAALIERLYAKQQGTTELAKKIPSDDPASRTLFFRAQGSRCEAPLTEKDPKCSAVPLADAPKGKLSGLYPAELLGQAKFCDDLGKKDKALVDPFTVVISGPKAVPYHEAYKQDVEAIATELRVAAKSLGDAEPALRTYLVSAAKSFTDDAWWPADEAWAKMDAKNSRFYLRIAPDEVYDEPCSTKALYHLSFGLINQASLAWQAKLDPLKTQMEGALAALAGDPYKAREVTFKLPDFVDIALNAGDSRKEFGATIGQSLPNFGPVANEGRGRTVAMTNFYADPDSTASMEEQAASLLCKETMVGYTNNQDALLMGTVLHEAAHNLGPAHQYQVNGKADREVFGGPLASTFEELKAQTAALYFTDWLVEKKQVDRAAADRSFLRDVTWAFGHISRGMYSDDHHPRNYSQLAAIQFGWLMKDGAIAWKPTDTAANGKDKGCFDINLVKVAPSVKALMTEVAQIKAKGDKRRAEALIKSYVDVAGEKKKMLDVVTERMLRAPKASFVYSIKLD